MALTFNEKCDKALRFLKAKSEEDENVGVLTTLGNFERGIGFSMNDPAIWYLEKDMKYIHVDRSKNPFVYIEPSGLIFITKTSFIDEENKKANKEKEDKEKRDLDLKLGRLTLRTQYLTWTNIGLTLLFSAVIVSIQVTTYQKAQKKEKQEIQKEKSDSMLSIKKLHTDSLINTALRLYLHQGQMNPNRVDTLVSNAYRDTAKNPSTK